MAFERWVRRVLLVVLTGLWLRLAWDVLFDFGPPGARPWFPTHAVVAISGFALLSALLNLAVLARPGDCEPVTRLPRTRKATIVAIFLASLFSCWAGETVPKLVDLYLLVPAVMLAVVLVPEQHVSKGVRLALLLPLALMLVPNDKCANPQNWRWVQAIGSSPLTYAAAVNVFLCLTMRAGDRGWVRALCLLAAAAYYAGAVYHRITSGY